jgi:hypothetical protein
MLRLSYSNYVRAWTVRVLKLGTLKEIFIVSKTLRQTVGAHIHPPVPWILGFLLRVKLYGREVNPSSLCNAKVKNKWSYTSTAPNACKAWLGKSLLFSRV